ncbi:MAG: membrane protein insertase YidC [Deltaproteobacteria bacterium]|nr:membrane protein insertase YidC [Deltaproteobacteria bacterium]
MDSSRLRTLLVTGAVVLLVYFFFMKPGTQRTARTLPERPVPTAAQRGPEQTETVRSGALVAEISTYSGAIRQYHIDAPRFATSHQLIRGHSWWRRDEHPGISTTDREPFFPLRSNVEFRRAGINVLPAYLTFDQVRREGDAVTLIAHLREQQVEVHRTIKPHTEFAFTVSTRVINQGAPGELRASQGIYHWIPRNQEDGKLFAQSWRRAEGLCHRNGRLQRMPREDMSKNGIENDGVARNADFVGLANMYFVQALIPQGEQAACHLRAEDRGTGDAAGAVLFGQLSWTPVQLATGESHDYRVVSYFGPKNASHLSAASPELKSALDLGYFAFIARGLLRLLQLLQSFVHNWGLAIMLLTIIVRTALFPLLARSMKSMAAMQKVKPELDAINAKYADDSNARGLATMELYRKHGVNPVAGCVPQIAQLPIWWALYTTLQTSVEIYHAPFALWIKDLSEPDPLFVLPLVLGAVMFVQQKLMPPATPDPMQAKIMFWFLPIFLTGISLFLPAGLALYMLVNSVLAIIQQRITKAQLDKMGAAVVASEEERSTGIKVRAQTAPSAKPQLPARKK